MGLRAQVFTVEFTVLTLFFTVTTFWTQNFYVGSLDVMLADLQYANQERLIALQNTIATAGVLSIPITGWLLDRKGFAASAAVICGVGVVFAVTDLVQAVLPGNNVTLLVVSFVANSFFRTFLFTYFFAYMGNRFGFAFYGVLTGLGFLSAGVASLLSYPLTGLAIGTCHLHASPCSKGNWFQVLCLQLGFFVLLCAFPVYVRRVAGPR